MDAVYLGSTGLQVSEIGFGTWRFGREDATGTVEVGKQRAFELLDAYAEGGGRFIDTADMYGDGLAETWIGEWFETRERDRESFVVASKVYWPTRGDPNGDGLGRKHLRRSVDAVLERLGTDYVDLLYTHRWDDETPVEEFMRTLDGFVADGRVHYLGTSTFEPNAWKVARANELADRRGYEPFTVAQPRYNLVDREIVGNYLEMSREYGIGVCPWSPLAGGFLTGKYDRESGVPEGSRAARSDDFGDRYFTEANFRVLDVLLEVANELDAAPAAVALAWLREQGTVPIVGARTPGQLEANLGAAGVSLTESQYERLSEAA
jgi:aryl-alcohol dehydrogenase-like predicted oxidoreductase